MNQSFSKVNILRRVAAVMLALLVFVGFASPLFASAELASGEVGNIKWSISGGLLTLKGKGAMPDFTEQEMAPWLEYSEYIRAVSIDSRLTHIGVLAFYDCALITAVQLPKKVKSIGDMAFAGCSAMESVTLPAVESLGEYAFSRCFKLDSVILPETLKVLGSAAFYRCESLRSIRVPASVTAMGGSVFAYCSSLMHAELLAPIEVLPEWSFYGCESLSTLILPAETKGAGSSAFTRCDALVDIFHGGSQENKDSFISNVITGSPSFGGTHYVDSIPEQPPVTSGKDFELQDDLYTETTTEIVVGEGASVESNVIMNFPVVGDIDLGDFSLGEMDSAEINIDLTVSDKDGWDTVISELERQLLEQGSLEMELGGTVPVSAEATLLYGSVIYGSTLKSLAGKDIVLRLRTPNGSRWSIDCSMLKGYSFSKSYDMEYELSRYEKPSKKHMSAVGGAVCYWIDFADRINFPATVEAYIDPTAHRQTATIYEAFGKSLSKLQSVMIGDDGTAHFRMGNVNAGKNYVVGLNVSGISADEIILPGNTQEGDWLETYVPVTEQYVITDVRGFMGMTMKQFTGIVIGVGVVLAFVVFIIILVVSLMGKRRAMKEFSQKQHS